MFLCYHITQLYSSLPLRPICRHNQTCFNETQFRLTMVILFLLLFVLQEIASYLISFDRHDEWLSCTLKTRYTHRLTAELQDEGVTTWLTAVTLMCFCLSGRRTAASSCTTGRRWSTGRTDTAGRKGRMGKRQERTTWSWRSRAWRSAEPKIHYSSYNKRSYNNISIVILSASVVRLQQRSWSLVS